MSGVTESTPIGTRVRLRRDNGEVLDTVTRSAAYVCSAGYLVVFLKGVTGYYLAERCDVVAPEVQP